MRNFLLGVVVGATGMGLYTGYIHIDIKDRPKAQDEPITYHRSGESPQSEEEGRVG